MSSNNRFALFLWGKWDGEGKSGIKNRYLGVRIFSEISVIPKERWIKIINDIYFTEFQKISHSNLSEISLATVAAIINYTQQNNNFFPQ